MKYEIEIIFCVVFSSFNVVQVNAINTLPDIKIIFFFVHRLIS